MLGGVVAAQGDVDLVPMLLIVWLAAAAGDLASFMLGRRLGRRFLVTRGPRLGVTAPRLARVEASSTATGRRRSSSGASSASSARSRRSWPARPGMRAAGVPALEPARHRRLGDDVHARRLRVPRVVQLRGRSGRPPRACRCSRRRAGARVPGAPPATICCMTTGDAAHDARRGWMPWLIGALVLPALGAVAVVALVEGVDLASWEDWQAAAAIGALFAVPAVLSAVVARRFGAVEAVGVGVRVRRHAARAGVRRRLPRARPRARLSQPRWARSSVSTCSCLRMIMCSSRCSSASESPVWPVAGIVSCSASIASFSSSIRRSTMPGPSPGSPNPSTRPPASRRA